MGLHGLLLAQRGLVVAQVATASNSAGWWHTITQENVDCKLNNEGAAHPMRNQSRTTMLLHESINGAAVLMQPCMGALLPIPHTAVEGHRFRLSRTHPYLPDGLTWAGSTELAGGQPPLPSDRTGCHTRGLNS